jgi:ribosomal protein S18 acetylase RimI-like enzyme
MSTELMRITPSSAMEYKAIRLTALQDSPTAFGSTYAREVGLSDADWVARAGNLSGERAIGLLAFDSKVPCGIAAVFIDQENQAKAVLVSMWVAPTHRRHGVGRLLIDSIVAWCSDRRVEALQLMVTSSNESAIEFYKRIGFAMTGNTEPYPNDPALFEYEMCRRLHPSH